MLNTDKKNFHIEVNDSTVSIFSGVARIGNALVSYPGGQTTFDRMLQFSGDTSRYQNVLLYLTDSTNTVSGTVALTSGSAYLAAAASPIPPANTKRELTIPSLPIDAGFPNPSYARGFPLAVFSFFSSDGTQGTLLSYYTI
jgi:hypothetical protein